MGIVLGHWQIIVTGSLLGSANVRVMGIGCEPGLVLASLSSLGSHIQERGRGYEAEVFLKSFFSVEHRLNFNFGEFSLSQRTPGTFS